LLGTLSVQNFILTVEKKTTNIIPVKNQFIISFLNNSIGFEIEISFFIKIKNIYLVSLLLLSTHYAIIMQNS
jgi:hypothetical protein